MQILYSFTKEIDLKKLKNKEISLKPDISCGIIDLKYNQSALKILEFGEIEFSAFKGHEALYGPGQIWGNLWKYLARFKKPIWYISSKGSSRSNDKAIDILYKIGGLRKKSFEELEKDPHFKQLCSNTQTPFSANSNTIPQDKIALAKNQNTETNNSIQDYAGIIVIKNRNKRKDSIKNIKDFEHFIILNENFTKYGENKHNCASLFDCKKLEEFKPKWSAYPCNYTPDLAKKIIRDLNCETLVIKPINSTRGQGVIIVEKENLDKILNKILNHSDTQALSDKERYMDSDYTFWKKYKEETFLVEAFERSKNITVNKKVYDATMRIVFAMSCEEKNKENAKNSSQKIEFHIIGAYWKLPESDIYSDCDLNEKHKSKISGNGISSAKVDPSDIESVGKALEKIIPEIYTKILEPL